MSSLLQQVSDESTMHGLAIVVVVLTALYYLLWGPIVRPYLESKKPFEELPMAQGNHWFLGHMKHLGKPFEEYLKVLALDSANDYGQTGYWFQGIKSIAVTNWKDARKVLLNESHRRSIRMITKHTADNFLGRYNILNLNGRTWKVQRAAITGAFSPVHHKKFQQVMVQVIDHLKASLRTKLMGNNQHQQGTAVIELDMEDTLKMVTLDVFGMVGLLTDFGCCKNLQPSKFALAFDFLQSEVTRRFANPFNPFNYFYGLPSEHNQRHAIELDKIRSFCQEKIAEKQKGGGGDDLLSRIMQSHQESKEQLITSEGVASSSSSEEALTDSLLSLLFGGYETTSIALTYALHLLDEHPEVESNCLQEIESLGDNYLSNPSDLVYCTAVIEETLRLFPPAFINSRCLQKPMELSGGFVAPKGTAITIPVWLLHRIESNWPRPEEFRPDRFVKRNHSDTTNPDKNIGSSLWVEREESDQSGTIPAANRNALFAFSVGARSCPGQSFALQEAVLVLAGLLKDFKFRNVPGYKLYPERHGFVQHPRNGMPMKIELRHP